MGGWQNRGAYISSIAKRADGKPAGAANGAARSAAAKAKGAAGSSFSAERSKA